jgi:glutamyl-tRNA synthetase
MTGRFAPSPSGTLHLGNLRTAVIAWIMARSTGQRFVLRMEDLDRAASSLANERSQLRDLAAIGLDWDNDHGDPVWRQSSRFDVYDEAIARLADAGLTYECYCSRREIREAAAAPHDAGGIVYPGTCRDLTESARVRRRAERPPAIRFRSDDGPIEVHDLVAGRFVGVPHDAVLRRNDRVPSYNVAVVVDDAAQHVDEVVRADDLLASTPTHIALQRVLGLPTPTYGHVGLVVGPTGERLAKRDGAVTLDDLGRLGTSPVDVRRAIVASMGMSGTDGIAAGDTLADLLEGFDVRSARTWLRHSVAIADLMSQRCDGSGIDP